MFSYLGAFLTDDLTVNVARIVFALGILAGVAIGFACWLIWNCDIFDEDSEYDAYKDMPLGKRLAPAAKLLAWVAGSGVVGGLIGALVGAMIVAIGLLSSIVVAAVVSMPVAIVLQAYANERRALPSSRD